ncbi:MAG: hypothetical protein AABX38_05015 [Candidatus Micrarchaeota archaeon]
MSGKKTCFKGFVLTIDAIMALLFMLVAIAIIFSYNLSAKQFGKDIYLTEVSFDTLSVLEKQGLFDKLITLGNDSAILDALSLTPVSVCTDLKIIQLQNNSVVSITSETGCGNSTSVYAISRRSFISNSTIYLGELRSWYR